MDMAPDIWRILDHHSKVLLDGTKYSGEEMKCYEAIARCMHSLLAMIKTLQLTFKRFYNSHCAELFVAFGRATHRQVRIETNELQNMIAFLRDTRPDSSLLLIKLFSQIVQMKTTYLLLIITLHLFMTMWTRWLGIVIVTLIPRGS